MGEQTYFESIMEGLEQAIAYEKGDKSLGRVRIYKAPDIEPIQEFTKEEIKEIRQKVDLPQTRFAELLGVSPRSVEAWEAGTRKPTGTAKRLFQMIDKNPNALDSIIRR